MKAKLFDEEKGHYIIACKGCGCEHIIAVGTPFTNGAKWTFNFNFEAPTFQPSLLVKSGKYAGPSEWYQSLDEEGRKFADEYSEICHSFITDGKIQYLSDCTHALANQTIELPEVRPGE